MVPTYSKINNLSRSISNQITYTCKAIAAADRRISPWFRDSIIRVEKLDVVDRSGILLRIPALGWAWPAEDWHH